MFFWLFPCFGYIILESFLQDLETVPPAIKNLARFDSRIRKSYIDRQHVSASFSNKINLLSSQFLRFVIHNSILHAGECWHTYKMCGSKYWFWSRKASCCIDYIQMSSPLEVIWSRKNKCFWPAYPDDWFCNWGTCSLLVNQCLF